MAYVVYEIEEKVSVRLVERESTAKGLVTKNNRALTWELLQQGHSYKKPWSHCSWAEFESVALEAQKLNRHNWHTF